MNDVTGRVRREFVLAGGQRVICRRNDESKRWWVEVYHEGGRGVCYSTFVDETAVPVTQEGIDTLVNAWFSGFESGSAQAEKSVQKRIQEALGL